MRGGRFADSALEAAVSGTSKMSIDEKPKKEKYCVLADLLIPGKGDPIEDGCVIVKDDKITFAGKADDVASQDADLPKTHVKVLMPGMWDCHVHLMGVQKLDINEFVECAHNQALTGARITRDVSLLLNAGFTRQVLDYQLSCFRH